MKQILSGHIQFVYRAKSLKKKMSENEIFDIFKKKIIKSMFKIQQS